MGGAAFCPYENIYLLWILIYGPCYASPKTTICGLKEFLIHSHSILHSNAIIHFTENEVGMFLEFIGLTVLPTMVKQLSLNGGMAF